MAVRSNTCPALPCEGAAAAEVNVAQCAVNFPAEITAFLCGHFRLGLAERTRLSNSSPL